MILLIIVPCVLCCVYAWRRRRLYLRGELPPVSTGAWPLVGHARLWLTGSFLRQLSNIQTDCIKQGGVTYLYFGSNTKYTFYALCDPEDSVKVASSSVEKAFMFEDTMRSIFGNGLLTCPSSVWDKNRQTLEAAFANLSGSLDVANQRLNVLANKLATEVGKADFDLTPFIKRSVMEILFLTIFAIIENDESISESISTYMQALEQLSGVIYDRHNSYFMQNKMLFNWSSVKRRQNESVRIIEDITNKIMKEKQGLLNFLFDIESQNEYTKENVVKEVATLMFSGYGTVSNGIMFIIALLGSHLEIQDRVNEEIQMVLGHSKRAIQIEDLSKLKLLEAVICEVLRLYPPVTTVTRKICNKTKLKKYNLKTNSKCLLFIHGLNRHPIWGENKDDFVPERWLNQDTLPERTFATFGLGKRDCIGKHLALNIMKIILVYLLRDYTFSADHKKMEVKQEVFLTPKFGHSVTLQQRTSKNVVCEERTLLKKTLIEN